MATLLYDARGLTSPLAGPLHVRKTRLIEADLAKRPAYETTYQAGYCREWDRGVGPLLSRGVHLEPIPEPPQTAPVTLRGTGGVAHAAGKGRLYQTTYQAAFCMQPLRPYASTRKNGYPEPLAIAGTTTHTAPVLRAIDVKATDRGDPDSAARTLSRSVDTWATPPDPRWAEYTTGRH
jgi:hypothetical protein